MKKLVTIPVLPSGLLMCASQQKGPMQKAGEKLSLLTFLIPLGFCFCLTGCPLVRASGDAVEATGEGVAHAVEGTGDAIGRAGHQLAP